MHPRPRHASAISTKNTALLPQFYRHLGLDARPQLSPGESDHARASLSPPASAPNSLAPRFRTPASSAPPFSPSASSPCSSSSFSMPGFASREKMDTLGGLLPSDPDLLRGGFRLSTRFLFLLPRTLNPFSFLLPRHKFLSLESKQTAELELPRHKFLSVESKQTGELELPRHKFLSVESKQTAELELPRHKCLDTFRTSTRYSAPGVPERGSTSTQRGLVDTPL